MKELKTYISEGFFNNVGANNPIKRVIDTIKDASINDKIDSNDKRLKFPDLLTPILKDIENNIKKGKFTFEYTRNDNTCHKKIIVSLEITEPGKARWTYSSGNDEFGWDAINTAISISRDLYYEAAYPIKEPRLRHWIAKTIEVTVFKLS